MNDTRNIELTVNGELLKLCVSTRTTLADMLRNELNLTGTHLGCEHGVCGACTVLVNGKSSRSCLMLAVQTNLAEIKTIEGLAQSDGKLHPLQITMQKHHGLQCGFCTPGVLMTLAEFLENCKNPTEADVREVLSGNLCRCTGYQGMVNAALEAASILNEIEER